MAGIYLHIPFCRQACRYCDFHFSVSIHQKKRMIEAMKKEIQKKSLLFGVDSVDTVYFGGGTPSVLNHDEILSLIQELSNSYDLNKDTEISFEANPDDLKTDYLEKLKAAGIDRLSIGIQSFRDKDLNLMRRSHNSSQAEMAVKRAQEMGFIDINCDLIYGFPDLTAEDWKRNLTKLIRMEVPHISAYHLSYEPGTVFDHWRKKNRLKPLEEEESLEHFKILKQLTREAGYIHYEISNFALPGFLSKHNLSYWKDKKYLGIGPSAHSYDGERRYWNISSNKKYMDIVLNGGDDYFDSEKLSLDDQYNEYILTGLRTMWGIDLGEIRKRFGDDYVKYTKKVAKKLEQSELIQMRDDKITILEDVILLSDQIMRDFFRV